MITSVAYRFSRIAGMPLTAEPMAIPDVVLLQPEVHEDGRGLFFEAWNEADFRAAVGDHDPFVQDNQSRSRAGVIRGLHYQLPNPQGKLVRVDVGEAFVVAVDIRRSAPTFGEWVAETLTAANHLQLWIPPGFAHGFISLADPTDMTYKVTAFYAPACDRAIRWNDPDIGIDWPDTVKVPVLSNKDRSAPLLRDAEVFP